MSRLGRALLKGLTSALADERSTWDLYKNKPFLERLSMVLYTSDILEPFFNIYYAIRSFLKNCKRLIDYAPLVWQHRNWDHGFVLRFNKKLYEDLYEGCYVDGHHIFTKKDARRLKVVINLLDRIQKEEYDHWHEDYLNNKYGKNDIYFKPAKTLNRHSGYTMHGTRDERMTEEQKAAYIKDRKRMWKHEEYQQKQDLRLLGEYIAKYSKRWWD